MSKIKGKLSKKKSRYSKGRSRTHTKRSYKRVNSKGRKKKKTSKKKKLRGGSASHGQARVVDLSPLKNVERKALRKLIERGLDDYCVNKKRGKRREAYEGINTGCNEGAPAAVCKWVVEWGRGSCTKDISKIKVLIDRAVHSNDVITRETGFDGLREAVEKAEQERIASESALSPLRVEGLSGKVGPPALVASEPPESDVEGLSGKVGPGIIHGTDPSSTGEIIMAEQTGPVVQAIDHTPLSRVEAMAQKFANDRKAGKWRDPPLSFIDEKLNKIHEDIDRPGGRPGALRRISGRAREFQIDQTERELENPKIFQETIAGIVIGEWDRGERQRVMREARQEAERLRTLRNMTNEQKRQLELMIEISLNGPPAGGREGHKAPRYRHKLPRTHVWHYNLETNAWDELHESVMHRKRLKEDPDYYDRASPETSRFMAERTPEQVRDAAKLSDRLLKEKRWSSSAQGVLAEIRRPSPVTYGPWPHINDPRSNSYRLHIGMDPVTTIPDSSVASGTTVSVRSPDVLGDAEEDPEEVSGDAEEDALERFWSAEEDLGDVLDDADEDPEEVSGDAEEDALERFWSAEEDLGDVLDDADEDALERFWSAEEDPGDVLGDAEEERPSVDLENLSAADLDSLVPSIHPLLRADLRAVNGRAEPKKKRREAVPA